MDRSQLEKIIPVVAQKHNFRLEIVEKDYYLTIILNNLRLSLSNKIIFKGGTLLNKIHLNYHRLSEDLDFVYSAKDLSTRAKRSKAMQPIRNKMEYFLENLALKSKNQRGEGFNNSTQYVFYISYPSFVTGKEEDIKIEISLRQFPLDKPVYNVIKHFYKNPFTGEDLIPKNKILSLSYKEAVAEKLKAAITRRDLAIRDYYDLHYIAEDKFDFHDKKFIAIFKEKLKNEGFKGDFRHNFGLDEKSINLLRSQITTELVPVIRLDETFNLDKVFKQFNDILKDVKWK